MGRFYDGDIQGKFWVGVQGSCDIERLVNIQPCVYYSWKVCDCVAEIDDDDYCRQCYETKEEHIEAAIEYENYEDECLYHEECSQGYSLDKSTHYEELVATMENLKKEIPEEILKEFETIEQNDKILDAFTGVFRNMNDIIIRVLENEKDRHNARILVARYTLGFQIEYCLRTTDECNINCEY